jgi:hypothetical protein
VACQPFRRIGGSVQTASAFPSDPEAFENYKPPEIACSGNGRWTVVDSDGRIVGGKGNKWMICSCGVCGTNGSFYNAIGGPWGMYCSDGKCTNSSGTVASNGHKMVFGSIDGAAGPAPGGEARYNFATGMWCNDDGTGCKDYSE